MIRLHQLLDDKPEGLLAVIDHDSTRYSYGALRTQARDLAEILKTAGVRGGDKVILVAENSVFYAASIFAASLLDVWIILVNARQSAGEITAIKAHSGARTILFTMTASGDARAHAARLGAREIGKIKAGPVVVTPLSDTPPEPVDPGPEQVAALLYTTGTTSAPKGVMLSHANLLFNARNSAAFAGLGHDDQVLAVLPGTHIYCLASSYLPAMAAGASARFVPRFDPSEVLGYLRQGITRFPAVPQMLARIIKLLDESHETLDAPGLRHVAAGGAPLDPDLKARVQEVFHLPLNNGYGLTETSPTVATTHNDAPRDDMAVGQPLPNVEVRIDTPNDEGVGEILVRGANVMKGYYHDPDRTAEVMTEDGFFRTGDLGRLGADGALFIMGRSKELIIRSGFNVHPPEIEAMLTRHPDVYQAAVIGRQVPGNEEILAFVLANGKVELGALRDWLKQRLVGYKIPQHILFVDSYPTAATGKILKHKLISYFAAQIPPPA